jgi:hypothetical protein
LYCKRSLIGASRRLPGRPGRYVVAHGKLILHGYQIVKDPVDVCDVQATMLHCLGIDHERLACKRQSRSCRLTDVSGLVVKQMLTVNL